MGEYIKISEGTRMGHYVSYARICVHIDVYGALPKAVKLIYRDEVWLQSIDYEHIPFRCKKCHEHGHLFWDFPMNKTPQTQEQASKRKDSKGYTKVISRNNNNRKNAIPKKNQYKEAGHNQFNALNNTQEKMDPKDLIGDEAEEVEMNLTKKEYDYRDTCYTNIGKDYLQEDTKMEQIETEETPEESAIKESMEGVDLAKIAEKWKQKGINVISKHQLQKLKALISSRKI